ncbi:hypothetical protein [Mycolicibacter sinensis]
MTIVEESAVDESEVPGVGPATAEIAETPTDAKPVRQLRLSISVRTLRSAATIVALVVAVGAPMWLYVGAQRELDAQAGQARAYAQAEKAALDYAVDAAEIDFHDLGAWKVRLTAGTAPELKEKLTKAGQEMEQILAPLEWASTARPLVAKVRSATGGIYVVDCFVSVLTKTVQGREPLQSTATYSVTIDSNSDWQISDVGGIGTVVEQK